MLLAERGGRRYADGVASFGANLKRERERRGISQVRLAGSLGIGQAQVSSWEKNRRTPSERSIRRIAQALSASGTPCEPRDLLAGIVTPLDTLRGTAGPTATTQPVSLLSPLSTRAKRLLRLFDGMSEEGQREMLRQAVVFLRAFPRVQLPESLGRIGRTTEEKASKARGQR